jgi:acid phosphatase (class A)
MRSVALLALLAMMAGACAQVGRVDIPDTVPELRPGILQGYLAPETLPDSAALLPAPPPQGSAAMVRDQQASASALALRGTPRWELAAADAELRFPQAAETFSCALGAPIGEATTPNLYMLLRRSLADLGFSTYGAKNRYDRARPFVVNGEPTCTPDDEEMLRGNGSYPSGHAAIGWGWALILAELAPGRADELLARGRAFAESRMICNVHWWSDVMEGQRMGAAAVARLHGDPVFRAQLERARVEVDALLTRSEPPARDCAAEAVAVGETRE